MRDPGWKEYWLVLVECKISRSGSWLTVKSPFVAIPRKEWVRSVTT